MNSTNKANATARRDLISRKLSRAARHNSIGLARDLLRQGAPVDARDALGRTALHIAAASGHTNMVDLLLRNGADLSVRDDQGMSALAVSALRSHIEVARKLLKTGADVTRPDQDVYKAVWHLVENGEFELAMKMHGAGATDPNFRKFCIEKATPASCLGFLMHMIRHSEMCRPPKYKTGRATKTRRWLGDILTHVPASDQAEVAYLLDTIWDNQTRIPNAMPEKKEINKRFDLAKVTHWALLTDAGFNMVPMFSQILMQFRIYKEWARVACVRNVRCTPFLIAVLRHLDLWNRMEVMRINDWSQEPGDYLAPEDYRSYGTIEQFVERGADVNTRDSDGMGPLAWAATIGQSNLVRRLIQWGADVNAADARGRTPLMLLAHLAPAWTEVYEIYQLLVGAGADINAADKSGETVLMWLAREESSLVSDLIEAGADVNAKDNKGRTALTHSVGGDWMDPYNMVRSSEDVRKLLIAAGAE